MRIRLWQSLAAAVLALLILVLPAPSSWGQGTDRIGTVILVDGTAEVQAQEASEWERLRFRDALFVNDTVRTGAKSKIKALLQNDSIITQGESTIMEFTEFLVTPQRRRTIISLVVGTLKVVAGGIFGARSVMEVHTPNTVAGIRGTTLIISFIPPDTTEITVLEGLVTARNLLAPGVPEVEQVTPNTRSRVVGGNKPSKPTAISSSELQALEQEVSATEQIPSETLPTEDQPPLTVPRGAEPGTTATPIQTASQDVDLGLTDTTLQANLEALGVDVSTSRAETTAIGENPLQFGNETDDLITSETGARDAIERSQLDLTVRVPRSQLDLTVQFPSQ